MGSQPKPKTSKTRKRRPAPAPSGATSAVIYCRVSTERQAGTGLGRDAQERACRSYVQAREGWKVAAVHVDDGLSGKLGVDERPGLAAAIEEVRSTPGAVLLVHSLSRFARSQRDLWELLDGGADPLPLVSATEPFDLTTSMGRAFVGMLGVIAALESDLASERTSAALATAKDRGAKLGAPTMIEKTDERGRRVVDHEKVERVRRVQELRAEGLSIRGIEANLRSKKFRTTTGRGDWHPKTIRRAIAMTLPTLPMTTMLRKQLYTDQFELEAVLDAWPNGAHGWQDTAGSALVVISRARVATSAEADALGKTPAPTATKTDLEAVIDVIKRTIAATLASEPETEATSS
jgi:site-specific DNA recombinase